MTSITRTMNGLAMRTMDTQREGCGHWQKVLPHHDDEVVPPIALNQALESRVQSGKERTEAPDLPKQVTKNSAILDLRGLKSK